MKRKNEPPDDEYKIGYGKPPRKTRFKKGESGNPSGRPRGITAGRARVLALKEAFRMVRVKEGDSIVSLPAIQAIFRGHLALAAKGNVAAQRAVIETVQAMEREAGLVAAQESAKAEAEEITDPLEIARRVAFTLELGRRELMKREKKN